jgi:hypothetical protein
VYLFFIFFVPRALSCFSCFVLSCVFSPLPLSFSFIRHGPPSSSAAQNRHKAKLVIIRKKKKKAKHRPVATPGEGNDQEEDDALASLLGLSDGMGTLVIKPGQVPATVIEVRGRKISMGQGNDPPLSTPESSPVISRSAIGRSRSHIGHSASAVAAESRVSRLSSSNIQLPTITPPNLAHRRSIDNIPSSSVGRGGSLEAVVPAGRARRAPSGRGTPLGSPMGSPINSPRTLSSVPSACSGPSSPSISPRKSSGDTVRAGCLFCVGRKRDGLVNVQRLSHCPMCKREL